MEATMANEIKPLFEGDFKQNGGKQLFMGIDDLAAWLKRETDFWAWLRQVNLANCTNVETARRAIRTQLAPLDQLSGIIPNLQTSLKQNPKQSEAYIRDISSLLMRFYGNREAIHSDSPNAKVIDALRNEDQVMAVGALAYFFNFKDDIPSRKEIEAICRVVLFTQGINNTAAAEKQALEGLFSKWTEELTRAKKDFQSRINAMSESHKAALDDNKQQVIDFNKLLGDCSNQTNGLVSSSTKELENIKKTYDDRLALQAPVLYWKQKATKHRLLAFVYTGLSIAAFIITGLGLYVSMPQVVGTQKLAEVKFHEIGLIVLVATIGVWAIRVFVRLMMSNIHLLDDATERRTMLLTYLALLRRDKLPKDDSRLLILQTLFRPASTGIVKDDASPPFMAQWLKMTTGSDDGAKGHI